MRPISKHIIWSGGINYVALKFTVILIGVSQSNNYKPKCCADIKLLIVEVDLINSFLENVVHKRALKIEATNSRLTLHAWNNN